MQLVLEIILFIRADQGSVGQAGFVWLRPEIARIARSSTQLKRNEMILLIMRAIAIYVSVLDDLGELERRRVGRGRALGRSPSRATHRIGKVGIGGSRIDGAGRPVGIGQSRRSGRRRWDGTRTQLRRAKQRRYGRSRTRQPCCGDDDPDEDAGRYCKADQRAASPGHAGGRLTGATRRRSHRGSDQDGMGRSRSCRPFRRRSSAHGRACRSLRSRDRRRRPNQRACRTLPSWSAPH